MTRLPAPGPAAEAGPATTYHEAAGRYAGTLACGERFEELTGRAALVRAVEILKARGEHDPQQHTADPGQPLTLAERLEVLAVGTVLASGYRHPSYVHEAVAAGATWQQVADATGRGELEARRDYRGWADGQHRLRQEYGGRLGLGDDEHAAAVTWAGDLPPADPADGAGLTGAELRTVLSALDVAADCKRDAAEACGDCDARPDGALCGTCEHRLAVADEYGALAANLRERL